MPSDWLRSAEWALLLPPHLAGGWVSLAELLIPYRQVRERLGQKSPMVTAVSSPLSTEELGADEPEHAARRVGAWRPAPGDWPDRSWQLASTVEAVVKQHPPRWLSAPIRIVRALREPLYIGSYLQAVAGLVPEQDLPTDAFLDSIQLIRCRPWPATHIFKHNEWRNAETAAIWHRPFCLRWVIADNRFGDKMRPQLWQAHSPKQAYLVTTKRTEAAGDGPTAVVHAYMPGKDSHYGRGGVVFPLWRDKEATDANASASTVTRLSEQYNHLVTGQQVWHYTAGLLGTEAYPHFWSDPMKATLRPHVPFPETYADFIALTEVGERLVEIARGHDLDDSGVRCTTAVDSSRLPTFTPSKCYLSDEETLELGGGTFTGVTAELWSHQISGYRALQRWIRSRSANTGGKTTSPLDRERPTEWTFTGDLIVVCNKIASLNNAAQVAYPSSNECPALSPTERRRDRR